MEGRVSVTTFYAHVIDVEDYDPENIPARFTSARVAWTWLAEHRATPAALDRLRAAALADQPGDVVDGDIVFRVFGD